jgi:hypothetical protein
VNLTNRLSDFRNTRRDAHTKVNTRRFWEETAALFRGKGYVEDGSPRGCGTVNVGPGALTRVGLFRRKFLRDQVEDKRPRDATLCVWETITLPTEDGTLKFFSGAVSFVRVRNRLLLRGSTLATLSGLDPELPTAVRAKREFLEAADFCLTRAMSTSHALQRDSGTEGQKLLVTSVLVCRPKGATASGETVVGL